MTFNCYQQEIWICYYLMFLKFLRLTSYLIFKLPISIIFYDCLKSPFPDCPVIYLAGKQDMGQMNIGIAQCLNLGRLFLVAPNMQMTLVLWWGEVANYAFNNLFTAYLSAHSLPLKMDGGDIFSVIQNKRHRHLISTWEGTENSPKFQA